ncbi:MAG TPA: cyclic nucleotide-binding domain-containing protein [Polyangia bacterium]|nr:cyclic nucleotide-binding domain-containing protein [Polyangia bacterium]
MRIEASVTSVSWIPSEAVVGAFKVPFSMGMSHYDDPPPDPLSDVAELIAQDRCRFCNQLQAFVEVQDGKIVGHGVMADGLVGSTTLRLGPASMTFAAVVFPTLRPDPVVTPTSVIFRQTCGARTGVPAPRPVKRPPYVQFAAPTAWTTLELEIRADGTSTGRLVGASPFPRHWIYGDDERLFQKSSVIDFKTWAAEHFGDNTPWGEVDSPALTSTVETALEREISQTIMREGKRPEIRTIEPGHMLCAEGEPGDELYLLLDGVLEVRVDGKPLAEIGPGAVLGERALIEGGVRTATLRAVTRCRVACVPGDKVDRDRLQALQGHHREEG